ncbi:MAG: hypothetical protein KGI41_02515 [Patescibacteria group bacterium]|nr:hypothetical protein [Patescibacteria group bacterium]
MKVSAGYTRYVVLTKHKAIKIPRVIGLLRIIAIPLRTLHEGGRGLLMRKLTMDGRMHAVEGVWRYAVRLWVDGFGANRRERELYAAHPELPIAPVMRTYLGGLILVMPRGEPLADGEYCPFTEPPDGIDTEDLFLPQNVCRFGKEFRFVDYGTPGAQRILTFLFPPRPAR